MRSRRSLKRIFITARRDGVRFAAQLYEEIFIQTSKFQLTLGLALACAALTLSLAVCVQAQSFRYLAVFNGSNGSGPSMVIQATHANFYATTAGDLSPLVHTVPIQVAAAFTVESDTYITATVPTGATTGTVSVVTPSGRLNSKPKFVVTK